MKNQRRFSMKKAYSKSGESARVTFNLPAEMNADTVYLCGDFNDWDKTQYQLKKRVKGNFSITISLDAGDEYRYRYWVDGERWENDWNADKYMPNEFGTEDSVVVV
jgi:1,4-alpha-glucan branching enzyme